MKSNKNFQKSKKSSSYIDDRESKVRKVDVSSKKTKYFKKEIFDEIDEFEDIELLGNKEEFLEDDEELDT